MMNNNLKKVLSLALVVGMFASVSPTAILADETEVVPSQASAKPVSTSTVLEQPEAEGIVDTPMAESTSTIEPADTPASSETTTPVTAVPENQEDDETAKDIEKKEEDIFDEMKDNSPADKLINESENALAELAEVSSTSIVYEYDPNTGEPTRDENNYITSTYGYSLKGDPFNSKKIIPTKPAHCGWNGDESKKQYWMQDENLFGKWDEENQKWTITSKLNYSKYEDLSLVEAAAKNGDYESAKLELYNYYINVERERNRTKSTTTSEQDRLTADLLLKNFMYNANSGIKPLSLVNVGNEAKYVAADVTATVSGYVGARQKLTFWVLATDKNGDWATFNSKEAEENKPYLRVKVNGSEKIIYASEDTYITAGSYAGKNFGAEQTLLARESAINNPSALVDSDTHRIYMKFDVSGLKTGDTVTSATLNLYGHNEVEGKEKECVVFYSDDSTWDEKTANYNSVLNQVIYSYDQNDSWLWNQPTNAGYRYQEELLRFNTWIDKLVKVYNTTGMDKYAYTALRLLMDYINVRGNDPNWLKTLDTAVRTQALPGYFFELIECEYMTPDIFTGFIKYIYAQANAARYYTTADNWGTAETLGLYVVCLNFPEFTEQPEWIARVAERYSGNVKGLMADDLSCSELAIGYVDYALSSLCDAKKEADKLHVTEYPFDDEILEAIHGLGRYIYYVSMPGVKDPQFGDAYSHRGGFKSRMTQIGNWFGDEELVYAGSGGADGKEPDFKSTLFPTGKKVVMRTGWDEKAMYLYSDVDGGRASASKGGSHAHPDDNSIIVMAHGQYLLVDPLYGSYTDSTEVNWLRKKSIAHNTITVNDKTQAVGSKQGTVERWETNESYDFSALDSPNTQDTSSFVRKTLFVKPNFWIVSDYVKPSNTKSNSYKQAWHFLPEANIEIEEGTRAAKTNFVGANIKVVPVMTEAEIEKNNFGQIVSGYYSEGQGSISKANYVEYQRSGSGNMVYNTVLFPENVGEDYSVVTSNLSVNGLAENQASAFDMFATNTSTNITDHYTYYVLHDSNKKGVKAEFSDISTDATMLFMEYNVDGTIKKIIAQDASYITKSDGTNLFKSDKSVAELSMTISGSSCIITSEATTPQFLYDNHVTVSMQNSSIQTCKLNEENVDFYISGSDVVFGKGDGSVTPKPTTKPTSKPNHGGGGGGGGGSIQTAKPTETPTPTPTVSGDPVPTPQVTPTPVPTMAPALKAELNGHWAEKEITDLYEKGIVKGQTETSFGLENQITRSEFVTLLVRGLNLDVPTYNGTFTDVSASDWYAGYIQAAYDNGLIDGFNDMALPNAYITREEMAKILAKAAQIEDLDIGASADQGQFTDSDEISDWAAEAVMIASKLGLIKGMDDGSFAPKQQTKRAEAFVVTSRLLEKVAANQPQEETLEDTENNDSEDPATPTPAPEELDDGSEQ